MQTRVADDYAEIKRNMVRIADDEQMRCPMAPTKLLVNRLRETAKCPEQCRFRDDWTGPPPTPEEDFMCG